MHRVGVLFGNKSMQIHKLKSGLQITGLGLGLSAVLILSWCLLWPCKLSVGMAASSFSHEDNKSINKLQNPKLSLKQFEPFWQKQIRRPLYDPPPKTATTQQAVVEKRSPPNVKLLGVAVEANHSLAMFLNSRGSIEVKGIGDILGDNGNDPQIVAIENQRVMLRYQGETLTLALEGDKGK
jgi:type II secretory pathway component PulC